MTHKIAALLEQARVKQQFDLFTFAEFEKKCAALIDSIGGNERILKTLMPLVYAIKVRRFNLFVVITFFVNRHSTNNVAIYCGFGGLSVVIAR